MNDDVLFLDVYDEAKKFDFYRVPALKGLILFSIGIIINSFLHLKELELIIIFIVIAISLLALRNKFTNLKIIACWLLLGSIISLQINNIELKVPNKTLPEMPAVITGYVTKVISKKEKSVRVIIRGKADAKQIEEISNINIILDIYKADEKVKEILPGNRIYAKGRIRFPNEKPFEDSFDEKFYARFNNVQLYASSPAKDFRITNRDLTLRGVISPLSESLTNQIEKVFPSNNQGIIKALITGDKSELSCETKNLFSLTGTAHVLAVSGLHVGIISAFIILFLGFFGNRFLKFILFSLLIVTYMFLTGLQVSVVRAGIMAILLYYSYMLDRISNPLNTISLVIILFILFEPSIIYSPAFQMSASSVMGIVLLFSVFSKSLGNMIGKKTIIQKFIVNSFALTFSASLLVAPIVAYYFNVYSIISPLTNLFVVPLVSFAMVFAIISLVLSYIWLPLGVHYAYSADLMLELAYKINKFAVSFEFSYIVSDLAVYFALLFSAGIFYILSAKKIKLVLFRFSVFAAVSILIIPLFPKKVEPNLRIIPFQNSVVVSKPLNDSTQFYLIADRKPKNYPIADFNLYNHLRNSEKNLIIGVTGNTGMALIDKLKHERAFKAIEIDIPGQHLIEKKLGIKEHLPQIIQKEIRYGN